MVLTLRGRKPVRLLFCCHLLRTNVSKYPMSATKEATLDSRAKDLLGVMCKILCSVDLDVFFYKDRLFRSGVAHKNSMFFFFFDLFVFPCCWKFSATWNWNSLECCIAIRLTNAMLIVMKKWYFLDQWICELKLYL